MSEHPELRILLDDEVGDRAGLESEARPRALAHLRGCARCRGDVAAVDPSLLFAVLGTEPVPEPFLERLSAGVEAAIDEAAREGTKSAPVGPRWRFASIAASLMLAGVLGTYLWNGPGKTVSPVRVEFGRAAAAGFELLSSPDTAQVLDLSVGETGLVMIFDENLDL